MFSNTVPEPAIAIAEPPQLPVSPFGVATTKPAGKLSVNATPFKSDSDGGLVMGLVVGLVMVMVIVLIVPGAMRAGLKVFAITGGPITVRVLMLLVVPAPPSVELTTPVVLSFAPGVLPVTSTEKKQSDPAAGKAVRVPPDKLIVPLPGVAMIAPEPQEPVIFGFAAITTPDGKMSLKATPLSALVLFSFLIVKVRVLFAFKVMLSGLKPLKMMGGSTTVRLALEMLPVPPSVEVT